MKKILFVFIFIVSGFIAFSQTATQTIQMRLNAMEVFDNYTAILSNLNAPSSYVKDKFVQLFAPDAEIYNDILPDNNPQTLSPEEYYNKFVDIIKSYSKFSDLEVGIPFQENGKWYVNLFFKKLFYIKFKQYELSYPEYTFHCEMLIEITPNKEKLKILWVKEPLQDYFILQLNDKKLKNNEKGLYYNNQKIEFADTLNRKIFNTEQYNISNFSLHQEMDPNEYKTVIKQHDFDKHYYQYNVKPLKNMVGVQVSYIPTKLGKTKNGIDTMKYMSGSVSLTYSRLIAKTKGDLNWYVNVNPGYSFGFLKIGGNYTDTLTIDDFKWQVDLKNISGTYHYHTFDLPFGIGIIKKIKSFYLTADLGFWINFNSKKSNISMDTSYYGSSCGGTSKLDASGYSYFGNDTIKIIELKNFDTGLYASIGAMFKLKDDWYLKTSVEGRYVFPFYSEQTSSEDRKEEGYGDVFKPVFNPVDIWRTIRFQINVGVIRKL